MRSCRLSAAHKDVVRGWLSAGIQPVFCWPSPALVGEGGPFPDMNQGPGGPAVAPSLPLPSAPLPLPQGPQRSPPSTPSVFHTTRSSLGNANPNSCASGLRAFPDPTLRVEDSSAGPRPAWVTSRASECPACPRPSPQPPPHTPGGPHTFPDYLTCLPRVGLTLKNKRAGTLFSKEDRGREACRGTAGDLGGGLGPGLRAVGGGDSGCQQRASVETEKGVRCACDWRAEREAVLWTFTLITEVICALCSLHGRQETVMRKITIQFHHTQNHC